MHVFPSFLCFESVLCTLIKAIISIFSGNNISQEEANTLACHIRDKYEFIETGVIDGKQIIYDFVIGIN